MIVKTIWASVMNNPTLMRKFNGISCILWIVMIPVSLYFGWLNSVTFVSALSLWALVTGHLAAYQAARVEEKQDLQMESGSDTMNAEDELTGNVSTASNPVEG